MGRVTYGSSRLILVELGNLRLLQLNPGWALVTYGSSRSIIASLYLGKGEKPFDLESVVLPRPLTLAGHGLEELFSVVVLLCQFFGFWREIGFGVTC